MSKNKYHRTFEIDSDATYELLLDLNAEFLSLAAFDMQRLENASFREFVQNAIGMETDVLDNESNTYDNIDEYMWQVALQVIAKQQNFATSIRELHLEKFFWNELEKLGVDIMPDDDNLSDQLTDAVMEACESTAKVYLMLLRDNQCNPPLDKFQEEVNESLERAYARLENYAFGILKTKLKESVEANR